MKQEPNKARKAQRRPGVCTVTQVIGDVAETRVLEYRSGKFHESIMMWKANKQAKVLGLQPR